MAAVTVEKKFQRAMEHAWIGAKMLHDGIDCIPVEVRIDGIISSLEEARRYHRASMKKLGRKAVSP